jgi:type I restriction enzyme S subunit
LEQAALGQTVPNLNQSIIERIVIPTPPHDRQVRFERAAVECEELENTYRRSLAELDALFASLQHRAFRGEI